MGTEDNIKFLPCCFFIQRGELNSVYNVRRPAGIWSMVRRYETDGGGGGWRCDHILTVKMYNLIMIDITLFIIGMTLLMTDIILYTCIILYLFMHHTFIIKATQSS